jgi:hypothetical protein
VQLKNASIIKLDGTLSSALQWTEGRKKALTEIARGRKIAWYLDLGLFDRLPKSLHSPEQFMTLSFAVDHFKDTLWNEFQRYSIGVLLYRGSPEFVKEPLEFVKALKARDQCADFLQQLASHVPEEIPLWIQFTETGQNPLLTLLGHDPSLYDRFHIDSDEQYLWGSDLAASEALLMPSPEIDDEAKLLPYLRFCLQKGRIKKIPEGSLISCWEGLDRLYYSEELLTASGRRQLQGFIAAGGEVLML